MKRVFLFGCGGLLLLLAIALAVGLWKLPSAIDHGKKLVWKTIEEERRIAGLESAWRPPSATPDAAWFPADVGEWRLERSEPAASIPDLRLDRPGHRAAYRSGAGTIEVNVVAAPEAEREALLEKIKAALERRETATVPIAGGEVTLSQGTSRFTVTRGHRTHVRLGGDEHARMWWVKGWLFVFRARGAADSESFPEAFLRAVPPPPADTPLERN
jgi:hypothetical protein